MKHIARKRFGQHFLTDVAVIEAIVAEIAPKPGQAMVEIGPGLAALSQPLVDRLGHLAVIELDRDLAARLRNDRRFTVIESDVLKVDFAELALLATSVGVAAVPGRPKQGTAPSGGSAAHEVASVGTTKLRVVGNLPYNISTPILFHLLNFATVIEDQHFMLQKEVVDRMVALPATSDYGRLSVMLQWRYEMENVLLVSPASFQPPPRVNSAVVRMRPRPNAAAVDRRLLGEIVQVAFSQRRKLLRHTLGKWLHERAFAGAFDVQRRAEEVTVAEYLTLLQQIQPAS